MDVCKSKEYVYRAIKPKYLFAKANGRISSSAFIDEKGLSVEIQQGRKDRDVEIHLKQFFRGKTAKIVKVSTDVCDKVNVIIFNDDSPNEFHRLLLDKNKPFNENGDNSLTDEQAFELARSCKDLEGTF